VNRDKVQAGMAASIGGYTFDELPWTPGLGGIFWWGSGGPGNDGTIHTFHSLYPLGHAWWGQIDNFSGQNLVGNWNISRTLQLQAGWLWFFYGDAVNRGSLARSDAEQLYLQVTRVF